MSREGLVLLAHDEFDGKLGLNWKPVRPDPSHVSLTKTTGTLTITTQRGSIHGAGRRRTRSARASRPRTSTSIDNPLAPGGDFVVTTCVSGFTPEMTYQQAGLIVYNDDDNYLKFGYEYNWPKQGGQAFCILTETDAKSDFHYIDQESSGLKRYWVRIAKRGNNYEYLTSTDGKNFQSHGDGRVGRRLAEAHRHPGQERRQQGRQRAGRQLRVLRASRPGAADRARRQLGQSHETDRRTQYLHGCWPMSRMLHAWITFKPRASARATSSGDSEPGLSQTSPTGFRATASISLRPILGGT